MKICILTPRFPFPENGGDVLRINHIARHLKSEGHQLVLVSFCEHSRQAKRPKGACPRWRGERTKDGTGQGGDLDEANKLYDKVYVQKRHGVASLFFAGLFWLLGKPIQCGYYYSLAYKRLFRAVVETEKPDRYIAHLLRMAPYLEQHGLQQQSIIEMTDALSKTYSLSDEAKGGGLKQFIYKMERELIRRFEQHAIRLFPKVVLVSQSDIDYLAEQAHGQAGNLVLHTNGVECPAMERHGYDPRKICFIGNMRTLQNQDAVLHFVDDILPLVREQVPDARLYIIGAEPPARIVSLGERQGVVVTGFVDDLEGMLADACLAVAPVRIAAGIQNKVLVAMANGLPVVMTSLISHAIPELRHGENCMICDENKDFAEACVRIVEEQALRERLAANGHETVLRHYSWQEKLHGYEDL